MNAVATALLCLYLPVPPIMLWIHGPIGLWRRLGRWSYAIHTPVYLAMVVSVALAHSHWSRGAWTWHPELRIAGGILVAIALTLLAITYQQIDSWTAMAGPQVTAAETRPLLTSGIYGVIRHPRYLVVLIGALGNFLLTGYPLVLAALVMTVVGTLVVSRIEDGELESHFGSSFREYRETVPGWIPRR